LIWTAVPIQSAIEQCDRTSIMLHARAISCRGVWEGPAAVVASSVHPWTLAGLLTDVAEDLL
jgi:hypothetical protein